MRLVRSAVITIAALAVSLPAAVAAQGAHADEHRKFDAVAMGASVMLGAKSQLKAAGVTKVDAVVNRQASVGPGLVRERGASLPEHVVIHKLDAVAIGDSVMLGAKSQLKAAGVTKVDAVVSRQAYQGPRLIRDRGASLPEHVVVHLGTNGTYTLKMCRRLVRAAGPARTVYLVTVKVPRAWEDVNNRMLRRCHAKFRSDQVVLVDWNSVASKNPEYLYADGYHLRPQGAKAFAQMVREAILTPRAPYLDRL